MSWFAELTSRAEDVLNKLDENAAVILSNPKSQKKDFILVDLSSDGVNSESNRFMAFLFSLHYEYTLFQPF